MEHERLEHPPPRLPRGRSRANRKTGKRGGGGKGEKKAPGGNVVEGALKSRAVARRGGRGRARTNVEAAGVLRGVITGPRASKGGGGQNAKPQTRPTLVSPSSTRPGPIYPKAVLDFGAPRSRNAIPFRLLICLLFFGFFCSQAHSSRGRCECLNRARASPRLVALIPEAPKPRIQFGGRGPVPLRKAQNFRPKLIVKGRGALWKSSLSAQQGLECVTKWCYCLMGRQLVHVCFVWKDPHASAIRFATRMVGADMTGAQVPENEVAHGVGHE